MTPRRQAQRAVAFVLLAALFLGFCLFVGLWQQRREAAPADLRAGAVGARERSHDR